MMENRPKPCKLTRALPNKFRSLSNPDFHSAPPIPSIMSLLAQAARSSARRSAPRALKQTTQAASYSLLAARAVKKHATPARVAQVCI